MSRLLVAVALVRTVVAGAQASVVSHRGTPANEKLALTYQEALARITAAPELRARAAAASGLRSARPHVSGLPSDLTLSVEAGPRLADPVTPQGRASVMQHFALGSLGNARRGVLGSQAGVLDAQRLSAWVARRIEVARAWLEVDYAHRALQVVHAEQGLAEQLAHVTARGAQLSELTRADAADATAYAAEAKLNVLSAEGDLTDARLSLTRALAISDRVLDVRGDPPDVPEPTAADERALHARIDQLPALTALTRELSELASREREVRALHAPLLGVGVSLDHTEPDAWMALGMLSVTLPFQDRGLRERAELGAQRRLLQGQLDEQRAATHVEIERLLHEIRHARATLNYAQDVLVPAVESGLQAREALFRAGEGTALEWIMARRTALRARIRRQRLQTELLIALTRFAELARTLAGAP